MPPDMATLMHACAPDIHPATLVRLVSVESSFDPNAIGIVGTRLERQPRSHAEAVITVRSLRSRGYNLSAGLAQINMQHWSRLGLDERTVFEPCANLSAAQTILRECFERAATRTQNAQWALRQALSCYYSGNFSTGFTEGYVTKVVTAPMSTSVIANKQRGRQSD